MDMARRRLLDKGMQPIPDLRPRRLVDGLPKVPEDTVTDKTYRIPVVKCALVRDGSVKAPSRMAEDPYASQAIARAVIGAADREHFLVILCDARNAVIGVNTVSIGTLTASLVHPREVFKPAILAGAAAVILAHNHPSGCAKPSPEDKEATRRLKEAGKLLGIPVLDHVIVAEGDAFSFRSAGIL